MRARRVRALLIGGQACVFYGAAEFSRNTDLAIVADAANLVRLRRALGDLQADVIAIPPFELGTVAPRQVSTRPVGDRCLVSPLWRFNPLLLPTEDRHFAKYGETRPRGTLV